MDTGRLNESLKELDSSIMIDSTNYYSFQDRGECYQFMNMKEEACADFRRSADLGNIVLYEKIKDYCN
jgi:hypothetical protein